MPWFENVGKAKSSPLLERAAGSYVTELGSAIASCKAPARRRVGPVQGAKIPKARPFDGACGAECGGACWDLFRRTRRKFVSCGLVLVMTFPPRRSLAARSMVSGTPSAVRPGAPHIRALSQRIERSQAVEISPMQHWIQLENHLLPPDAEGGHHRNHGNPGHGANGRGKDERPIPGIPAAAAPRLLRALVFFEADSCVARKI